MSADPEVTSPFTSIPFQLITGPSLKIHLFPDAQALAEHLRQLISCEAADYLSVLVVHGERVYLTKGPTKYLLVPGQDPIPLFSPISTLEPDTGTELYDWEVASKVLDVSAVDANSSKSGTIRVTSSDYI